MNNIPLEKPVATKEPFYFDPLKYTVWAPIWWTVSRALIFAAAALLAPVMIGWALSMTALPTILPIRVLWNWIIWVAVLAFLVVFFWFCFRFYQQDQKRAMDIMEKITNRDINGDGTIGAPPSQSKNRGFLLSKHGKDELRVMDIGADGNGLVGEIPWREYLPLLAEGLLHKNRPFSQREWAGEIPKEKFEDIQQAFVEQGRAIPKNGKNGSNGYVLTQKGVDTLMDVWKQANKDQVAYTTAANTPLPYFTSQQQVG